MQKNGLWRFSCLFHEYLNNAFKKQWVKEMNINPQKILNNCYSSKFQSSPLVSEIGDATASTIVFVSDAGGI